MNATLLFNSSLIISAFSCTSYLSLPTTFYNFIRETSLCLNGSNTPYFMPYFHQSRCKMLPDLSSSSAAFYSGHLSYSSLGRVAASNIMVVDSFYIDCNINTAVYIIFLTIQKKLYCQCAVTYKISVKTWLTSISCTIALLSDTRQNLQLICVMKTGNPG